MLFGFVVIAFVAFLLATSLMNTSASDDTKLTAPGDYQGADSCQSCHFAEYTGWQTTDHAQVFTPGDPFFETFISRGAPDSCQPCHTAGYGQTTIGGYDSAQAWNSSYNTPLLAIQCENCHGPDTMFTTVAGERYDATSENCAQCHYGARRPQFTEWNQSAHASGPPAFVKKLECAECHEAKLAGDYVSTGEVPTALPANPVWQLTCATCHDPHDGTNDRQLRKPVQELCQQCHNSEEAQPGDAVHHPQAEMREGAGALPVASDQSMSAVYCAQCHMYGYAYNSSLTPPAVGGHTFEPKPEACASCHNGATGFEMSVEQAENAIHNWQAATGLHLESARSAIENATAALDAAPGYGFDLATTDRAQRYYEQAVYAADFVEADGSMGAHNFDYAANLLSFADLKAGQVMSMLSPGTLNGTVVDSDGDPVQGVQIKLGDKVWATSAADGTFSFAHAPGSFTFALVQGGAEAGTVDAVILAGQTSDVRATLTAAAPPEKPAGASETLQYAILLLLVVAILMLVVMMMKRKPATAAPKAAPMETPEQK
jgi:predicted CXXCH cytochrome family protein